MGDRTFMGEVCIRHPNMLLSPSDGTCRACAAGIVPYSEHLPPKEEKRPLIEISRMGPVVKAIKALNADVSRLADALEQILIEAYGYHTDIPTTDTSGPEPRVMYTDHDEHDIRDIVNDLKERK